MKKKENKNNNAKNIHLDEPHANNSLDEILDIWEIVYQKLQMNLK